MFRHISGVRGRKLEKLPWIRAFVVQKKEGVMFE